MTVSILGCGWFGTGLAKSLIAQGLIVKASTTHTEKLNDIRSHVINIQTEKDSLVDEDFFRCGVLVIANNVRMTDEGAYLARLSYTIELIKRFGITKVIFVSSTSVYGDHNVIVNERTLPMPDTLSAAILLKGENLLKNETTFNTIIIRFGGLIGPGRDPGRFFAGKSSIPNGLAPVNLIHLEDCIGITELMIKSVPNKTIVNAIAPDHPTKQEFYRQSAIRAGLIAPQFIAEKIKWKVVHSIFSDYRYLFSDLMTDEIPF